MSSTGPELELRPALPRGSRVRSAAGDARRLPCTPARTTTIAATIAGALLVAVAPVGLVVGLALASSTRRWLAFPFTGIPARPAEAVTIFLHNLRALAAVGGLLLVAQSRHWDQISSGPGAVHRTLQRLGEALLAAAVLANVIVIGASIGAYGFRMIRAALPHGPFELAAYSLALALYIQGRDRQLPIQRIAAVAAASIATLALAAALETFVSV